jgi:formate/nitrite transporter FocA (FNT family)
MLKFFVTGGAAGALLPLAFMLALRVLTLLHVDPGGGTFLVFMRARLMLWPSSLFLVATAGSEGLDYGSLAIYTVSCITNGVLYGVAAILLWYGCNVNRIGLLALAMALVGAWFSLLRL